MNQVVSSEQTDYSAARVSEPQAGSSRAVWLFSARTDLTVFLGSALVSLLLLLVGAWLGILHADAPDWTWIGAVLLIDVAHVYSTNFRVYLDPDEFKRRPWLYGLVPLLSLAIGIALYSEGAGVFWRVLAFLAVFHFIRQQYGWVALYRARAGEHDRFGRWIDTVAIYAATVYPLLYWQTHLPRRFWWFLANDFVALPVMLERVGEPVYWLALFLYFARSLWRWWVKGALNPGKDIVVLTTAICWYVGIVALNSDYAFTVTNVIIHGVPYIALIYWYGRQKVAGVAENTPSSLQRWFFAHGPYALIAALWLLAFVEEMIWDKAVWHERAWLFGTPWQVETIKIFLVPLLALPQITHYVLDGFIWRRRSNPDFARIGEAPA